MPYELAKFFAVISEVVIGNPFFLKNKEKWIPAFAAMTVNIRISGLLQEPHVYERRRIRGINLGTSLQYLSYAAPKRFLSSCSSSMTTRYITGI